MKTATAVFLFLFSLVLIEKTDAVTTGAPAATNAPAGGGTGGGGTGGGGTGGGSGPAGGGSGPAGGGSGSGGSGGTGGGSKPPGGGAAQLAVDYAALLVPAFISLVYAVFR